MICPDCKAPIPPQFLTCPVCLDRRVRAELFDRAALRVPDLVAGRLLPRLWRKRGHSRETHIALFNDIRSFCGQTLAKAHFRLLAPMPYYEARELACSHCVNALDAIIAENTKPRVGLSPQECADSSEGANT